MLFSRIQGHATILSGLEKSIQDKKVSGAYLFTGPSSVGKFTIARQLSKYLLCTGLLEDTCRCECCRLFPNISDYLEISKGSENIVVSDVENIEQFLSLVPFKSHQRVVLVDNAHKLNTTASNRLLKLTEELNSNCVVILVTDSPQEIVSTLISRCFEYKFNSLLAENLLSILKTKGHSSSDLGSLEKMLPHLSGSVITDFPVYASYVKEIPAFVKNLSTILEDNLVNSLIEIDSKQELPVFTELFIIFLNDILKIRYNSPDIVFNSGKIDFIEGIVSDWKEDICILAIDKLHTVHTIMQRNLNLKHIQYVLPVFLWLYYFIQKEKKLRGAK